MSRTNRSDEPELEIPDGQERRPAKWANASANQAARAWADASQLIEKADEVGKKIRREIRLRNLSRDQASRTEGIARRHRVERARKEIGLEVIDGGRNQ